MARITLILCLILFALSGCDDANVPIEADDFGYPKVVISASGLNITGTEDNELSQWSETGYKYSGDPLTVMVYNNGNSVTSQWCAWFGANEATLSVQMQGEPLCDIATPADTDTSIKFNTPGQPPCIFSKGQGLYLLLTNPTSDVSDPNSTPEINRAPSKAPANFATLGLWQDIPVYSNNALAGGYYGDFPNSSTYINGHAYFKILDKYYDDNSGGYYLALKRGFNRIITPPIAYTIDIITTRLNTTAQSLFETMSSNEEYLTSMRAVIMLYIIISGILYLGGMLHMSDKELINMFIKLVIVIQLVTTKSSWQFFDEYFFQFFTSGLADILNIVTATFTGNYSTAGTEGTLTFFDQFLDLLFSYETNIKILAVIISVPSGFVTALMIYIAFAIFTVAIIQAVILYLLCMMAISILIMLGPIFIPLLLFKTTKSLFEGWINQFANYFFQPILVFASITLFGQMIVAKIYQLLGFGACYDKYIYFNVNGTSFTLLKAWQICSFSMNSIKDNIAIPGYGFWTDDPNKFCEPYECMGERYIELPFLDTVKDASLIKAFEDPWNDLNTPMLYNAAILLLICYLMTKINDLIPDIAKSIAGTASEENTGRGNKLKQAAGVSFDAVYGSVSKMLKPKSTARSREIHKNIESYSKAINENRFFKAGKAISKLVIPPLSMNIDNKETMQRKYWEDRAEADRDSGRFNHTYYNRAKGFMTKKIHSIQDRIGSTIENTYDNLRGRPSRDQLKNTGAPVGQDYSSLDQNHTGLNAPINPSDKGHTGRTGIRPPEYSQRSKDLLSDLTRDPNDIKMNPGDAPAPGLSQRSSDLLDSITDRRKRLFDDGPIEPLTRTSQEKRDSLFNDPADSTSMSPEALQAPAKPEKRKSLFDDDAIDNKPQLSAKERADKRSSLFADDDASPSPARASPEKRKSLFGNDDTSPSPSPSPAPARASPEKRKSLFDDDDTTPAPPTKEAVDGSLGTDLAPLVPKAPKEPRSLREKMNKGSFMDED